MPVLQLYDFITNWKGLKYNLFSSQPAVGSTLKWGADAMTWGADEIIFGYQP